LKRNRKRTRTGSALSYCKAAGTERVL
jgi:hypothetical protein